VKLRRSHLTEQSYLDHFQNPRPLPFTDQRSLAAIHVPVLLRETLQALDLRPGLTVVDGTVGGGGHSRHILPRIQPHGTLIGLDRDPRMLQHAATALTGERSHLCHSSYQDLPNVLRELRLDAVDRILVDLGLSSDQLADRERGFGFGTSGRLDMRFDDTQGQPAAVLLANATSEELARIFHEFGEERFSRLIADQIVRQRRAAPIESVADLLSAIDTALPTSIKRDARKEPATRVFQALRIAVNRELEHLRQALEHSLYESLRPGGRLVVITFHSLEDRLVKHAFRDETRWHCLHKKPVCPSPQEIRINPRSRSAKLRAAIKQPIAASASPR
jgi:16S rRNA (cytosine1402-N4)-methyltransferase